MRVQEAKEHMEADIKSGKDIKDKTEYDYLSEVEFLHDNEVQPWPTPE